MFFLVFSIFPHKYRIPHPSYLKVGRSASEFGNIKIINKLIFKNYTFDTNSKYFLKFAEIAKAKFGIKVETIKTYGSTDARFFAEKKIPTLVISPVGGEHHGKDEWIDLDDLERYYKVLKEYVLAISA